MQTRFLRLLLVFIITEYVNGTNSQNNTLLDSLKEKFRQETLHLQNGYVVKGENGLRISNHELREQFIMSPQALDEFNKYEEQRKLAKISKFLSYACIGAAAFLLRNNKTIGLEVLTGGFVITNFVYVPLRKNATRLLEHAIFQRNSDMMFQN